MRSEKEILQDVARELLDIIDAEGTHPTMINNWRGIIEFPQIIKAQEQDQREIKRRRENARRRNATAHWTPLIIAWVHENLKPGMLVKFVGTRDKGYRKVIEVHDARITAQKINEHMITQHGPGKLSHVKYPNGYRSIKDIIRCEQRRATFSKS